jgi:hypothetical protein
MIRGGSLSLLLCTTDVPDQKKRCAGLYSAFMSFNVKAPRSARCSDFLGKTLTLREKAKTTCCAVPVCEPQKLFQWRESARRHNVSGLGRERFYARAMDNAINLQVAYGLLQERCLSLVRFDKSDSQCRRVLFRKNSNNKTGKPSAGPQIKPALRLWRTEANQLCRINNVPVPDVRNCTAGNQVYC